MLFEYQKAGVRFLAGRKAALLADDPRLGKTIQSIKALDAAMVLRVCVICPAGVIENWKRQIAVLREGDWQAFVTSYDNARGRDYARIMAEEWDVMIIDEAHALKNINSKRSKAIYGEHAQMGPDALAGRAAQVWLLTGTPMLNHAGELYTHLRALFPQAVVSARTGMPWSQFQFEAAYCKTKHTGFGLKIVGSKNEEKLHAKLDGFMLRRRKADVLPDLPPLTVDDLFLEGDVSGLPGDEIEIVRKALAEHGVAGLRTVAPSVATLRRLTGMAKVKAMCAWANDWMDSRPPEEKLVIFAHHADVIDALYAGVGRDFVRIGKTTPADDRQRSIDRFRDDPAVRGIICRMRAEGVGISLARSDEMVVLEPDWVPAINAQVYERIVDIGKTNPCHVWTAMIAKSIDEDIQRACAPKSASIARVVDGLY